MSFQLLSSFHFLGRLQFLIKQENSLNMELSDQVLEFCSSKSCLVPVIDFAQTLASPTHVLIGKFI